MCAEHTANPFMCCLPLCIFRPLGSDVHVINQENRGVARTALMKTQVSSRQMHQQQPPCCCLGFCAKLFVYMLFCTRSAHHSGYLGLGAVLTAYFVDLCKVQIKPDSLVCRICDGLCHESYGGEMEAAAQHCSTIFTSHISGTYLPLLLPCSFSPSLQLASPSLLLYSFSRHTSLLLFNLLLHLSGTLSFFPTLVTIPLSFLLPPQIPPPPPPTSPLHPHPAAVLDLQSLEHHQTVPSFAHPCGDFSPNPNSNCHTGP